MRTFVVVAEESGSKLLSFLTQALQEKYSAKFLKRLIEQNRCQINGRTERFASTVLGTGDLISLDLEEVVLPLPPSMDFARILFEDDAILVYDKPSGITCDAQGILQLWQETLPHLQLVHRLDKETSGVLLLAKSASVFENLVAQFKQFQVAKHYLAIVDGECSVGLKGYVENYLGKKKVYAGQTIWGKVRDGLYAYTAWECVKRGKNSSLFACTPKTGRTHQIRVHMAEIGHPILGDFQYGRSFQCSYRPPRILLHAEAISFAHPITGNKMSWTAPLPEDFKKWELCVS